MIRSHRFPFFSLVSISDGCFSPPTVVKCRQNKKIQGARSISVPGSIRHNLFDPFLPKLLAQFIEWQRVDHIVFRQPSLARDARPEPQKPRVLEAMRVTID